jgi:PilZ domain
MSGKERRTSPRKDCVVPLRFRVLENPTLPWEELTATHQSSAYKGSIRSATLKGEAVNLSERGIYFTSRATLVVGELLEMYFSLPGELTGRGPEQVRCNARIVHVENREDLGALGIGAIVERFQPILTPRDWAN